MSARTRLDDETMVQAATALGLNLEVAYKRRQNIERRIAAFYDIRVHRGSHHRQNDTPGGEAGT